MPEPASVVLGLMLVVTVAALVVALLMFIHGLRARATARPYARLAPPPRAGARKSSATAGEQTGGDRQDSRR
ncbi:MAG TPA: hypothetical protein PKM39_07665 [Pseudothauera hydrothermalis]|jgi:hypothetical protein|uniref:hypothetical protein n=1 Tax=Pseudothauera hydrothermalis TaxID=2184083 RepID=UPI000C7E26A5|nr:hypothetical protein [Pseudothauera hydrothermalis]AUM01140.1 hypothetical protein B4966_14005 [Rhodocyclaceae bacterium]AVZ80306.1 hypothetical protein C3497_13410 [Zoogloeaceae bacteirum Par-f-2]HNQ76500.1 hypothetical protein [Pseudothauera hydrothermalis]